MGSEGYQGNDMEAALVQTYLHMDDLLVKVRRAGVACRCARAWVRRYECAGTPARVRLCYTAFTPRPMCMRRRSTARSLRR